jgi:hypothetical protein
MEHSDPCATAFQVHGLFRKFVHEDGSGRRDQLPQHALVKGRVYAGAPTAKDCVAACTEFGYLDSPNYRGYVRRGIGEQYSEIVGFVRDWRMSARFRAMLDKICPIKNCPHVFE